jgi:predicted ATP-grasp superfamily ATP-dependent carboligase
MKAFKGLLVVSALLCLLTIPCLDALTLTQLYNSKVVAAQRYERPLDNRAPAWIREKLPSHCGVVVTLENSRQRWLVHKGNQFGEASETVVVSASAMSSNWSLKRTKSVRFSNVADYVKVGGKRYSLLHDNSLDACSRMMKLP